MVDREELRLSALKMSIMNNDKAERILKSREMFELKLKL